MSIRDPWVDTQHLEPFPLPPWEPPTPERWAQPVEAVPPLSPDEVLKLREIIRDWDAAKEEMGLWEKATERE